MNSTVSDLVMIRTPAQICAAAKKSRCIVTEERSYFYRIE